MNEAEYLMKNYRDRGGCYTAEVDNTLIRLPHRSINVKFIFDSARLG